MFISDRGSKINGIDFPSNLNIYASKPIIGTSLIASIGKMESSALKILSYIGYILGSILTVGLLALFDHIVKRSLKAEIVFAGPGNTKCVYLDECTGKMPYKVYDDILISYPGALNPSAHYVQCSVNILLT